MGEILAMDSYIYKPIDKNLPIISSAIRKVNQKLTPLARNIFDKIDIISLRIPSKVIQSVSGTKICLSLIMIINDTLIDEKYYKLSY